MEIQFAVQNQLFTRYYTISQYPVYIIRKPPNQPHYATIIILHLTKFYNQGSK